MARLNGALAQQYFVAMHRQRADHNFWIEIMDVPAGITDIAQMVVAVGNACNHMRTAALTAKTRGNMRHRLRRQR